MPSVGRTLSKVLMDEVGGAITYNVAVQRQEEYPVVFCLRLQYFRDKIWYFLYMSLWNYKP